MMVLPETRELYVLEGVPGPTPDAPIVRAHRIIGWAMLPNADVEAGVSPYPVFLDEGDVRYARCDDATYMVATREECRPEWLPSEEPYTPEQLADWVAHDVRTRVLPGLWREEP